MSIRAIPLADTADIPSELVPLDEAARRLGISTDTVRRWIKADMADGKGRVPGSRGEGSRYVIVRAIFERAMRNGQEPERAPIVIAPELTDIVSHLRQRAAEDLELAAQIEAAIHATRQRAA